MDNVARSLKEVRIYFIAMKVKVQVAQLGPTLCDPMDYTVHAILQARILEWGAFPFSRSKQKQTYRHGKQTQVYERGKGVEEG